MRQIKKIMPIYSGDVSGVPSALYELGGMVIMHDASGCNSTYNTHDELRWYDRESLIYISAMTELDAVLGDDARLIAEITEAAEELKPAFIAIAGTPIPYLNGMDFRGVAKVLTKKTGIETFFVPTNGTHTYIRGVAGAWAEIARRFVRRSVEPGQREQQASPLKVNVLGLTPLDFALSGYEHSVKQFLEGFGFTQQCCFAMGSLLEDLVCAGDADVNLIVSSTGFEAAEVLWERFGIPCVAGAPVGGFREEIADALHLCVEQAGERKAFCQEQETAGKKTHKRKEQDAWCPMLAYGQREGQKPENTGKKVCVVGESVISESLAAAIAKQYDVCVQVLCPVETYPGLLLPGDRETMEEDDLTQALADADVVIADELLRPLCSEKSTFYPLPHVACSGRIYAGEMPDLSGLDFSYIPK